MAKKKSAPNRPWRVFGALALLALLIIGGYVLFGQSDDNDNTLPNEISVAEAAEKRADGAFILDVREPSEWDQGHIPGATLIPLGELASRVAELPQDQAIVVVCRSGNRSATARDILKDVGFSQVTSMAGGMNEWTLAGYPVE